MKRINRLGHLCLVIAVIPAIWAQSSRPFTVEDDIAMVRFSDPRPQPGVLGSEIAKQSPDGKHIAVVTSKGLLSSDRIESQLSVFDTRQLSSFLNSADSGVPQPRLLVTVISYPHREQSMAYAPVIKDMSWSPDGTELVYKVENLKGRFELYIANIDGSHTAKLSSPTEDVDQFDMAGDTIVYTSSIPNEKPIQPGDFINADARVVTGVMLNQILFQRELAQEFPQTHRLTVLHRVRDKWVAKNVPHFSMLARDFLSDLIPFKLSPDRKKLLTLTPVLSIAKEWERFQPAPGYQHTRFRSGDASQTDPMNPSSPRRYVVINLETGSETPVAQTPEGRSLGYYQPRQVVWSSDSRHALVTNVFTALKDGPSLEKDAAAPCAVLSVDLPALETRCLFRESTDLAGNAIERLSFGQSANQVNVKIKRAAAQPQLEAYSLIDGAWTRAVSGSVAHPEVVHDRTGALTTPSRNVTAVIRQSLNEPPALWAEDRDIGKSRLLWDPNPQFSHIRFAPVSILRWTDKSGYEWNAEMVTPLDYVPGTKYPLVIQMYTFEDGQFVTDGLDPTAFVARHLGSVGFFVLQIKKRANTFSESDPQASLEGYRSAIETLAKRGMVDPGRVGVVGFSWTCWYAVNAIVKEPSMFAAATVADGLHYSYPQYLLFAADAAAIRNQMEAVRGGNAFGEGLKRWIAESPNFHFDRVRTPVRIEAIHPSSILQEWDLYSSLRMQQKPVELVYFPNGTHIHQKPLERLESQQGDVDWFRFWLQNYEDPSPSKSPQYARWNELRRLTREPPKKPSER